MKTSDKIIKYLKNNKQVTGHELAEYLEISRQGLFKQLNKLLDANKITKVGKPPKVFYSLSEPVISSGASVSIDQNTRKIIDERFLIITPAGERREGWEGFLYWCGKTKKPPEKTPRNT